MNWAGFAKSKLLALIDLFGDVNKRLVVSGYRISLRHEDGVKKVTIKAPPGAVVSSMTGGGRQYRYADMYGGDLYERIDAPPSGTVIPEALFSSYGEIMYHGHNGFSAAAGEYGAVAASWVPMRSDLPADPRNLESGYLAGVQWQTSTEPATVASVSYEFTNQGLLFAAITNEVRPGKFPVTASLYCVGPTSRVVANIDFSAELGGNPRGMSMYARPARGYRGMLVYTFYAGACGTPPGSCGVMIHYLEAEPGAKSGSLYALPIITDADIASGLGLPAPCDSGVALSAMSNLLGQWWPIGQLPLERGMFACNEFDVCCWGPVPPSSQVRGVIFGSEGVVSVVDIVLPPYTNTQEKPVITEVSPGRYVCEVWGGITSTDRADYFVSAVYYGSPFDSWVGLDHPDGVILRHKAVVAEGAKIVALAIIYNPGSDTTELFEYDSEASQQWSLRGKVCDGYAGKSDVALFGEHGIASAAAAGSPVRLPLL